MQEMQNEQQPGAAEEEAVEEDIQQSGAPSRTLWSDAWKRLKKNKLAMIAIIWIAFMVVVAVTADLWAPQWLGSPTQTDTTQSATMSKLPPLAGAPLWH